MTENLMAMNGFYWEYCTAWNPRSINRRRLFVWLWNEIYVFKCCGKSSIAIQYAYMSLRQFRVIDYRFIWLPVPYFRARDPS